MEMATIEQIHRVNKLPLNKVEKLPVLRRFGGNQPPYGFDTFAETKLSRDDRIPRSCAVKEFRFPPPYTGKKKKKKKLPPIPENVFPRRHNTVEDLDVLNLRGLTPLPEIAPILTIREHELEHENIKDEDDRLSEGGKASRTFGCVREFTFPVSSAKRKRDNHMKLKPRTKELPLQARIEKLARKKRKAKQAAERKEEKKQQMTDLKFPALQNTMAFKARRDRQTNTFAVMKESRSPSFKPLPKSEEPDRPRVHPRLYTKIVDSIYTYSRGITYDTEDTIEHRREPYERLPVTPVTTKDDRENYLRASHFSFPPLI